MLVGVEIKSVNILRICKSTLRRPHTSIYHTLVSCYRFVLQVSVIAKSACNKPKPRRQFNNGRRRIGKYAWNSKEFSSVLSSNVIYAQGWGTVQLYRENRVILAWAN